MERLAERLAINDPVVPGDDCSPSEAAAVGQPPAIIMGEDPTNALNIVDIIVAMFGEDFKGEAPQVNPLASENNPGQSTGAKGEERSEAPDHCQTSGG